MIAGGVVDEEVVLHGREWHDAAHGQIRNIHEETEVAHFGDQRRIHVRISAGELGLEVGKPFDVLAVALGIGRGAFRDGNVFRDRQQGGGTDRMRFEQAAMHHEIGVAANRRGEVGVLLFRQAEMSQRFQRVAGPHERLEEADLERRANGKRVELVQEALNLGALAQIAARHIVAEHFLAVFLEPRFLRGFVDPVDCRLLHLHEASRHGLVGQQHVLLDELMRDVVLDSLDPGDATGFVETDLHFRKVEFERTRLEPGFADLLSQIVGLMHHLLNRVGTWLALQEREDFPVGKPLLRVDNGRIEFRIHDPAVVSEEELDALGQAIHLGLQRTQFIAERFGEHRDDPVHQVRGIAALAGFGVQRRAGPDIVGHIGDVNPQAPLIGGNPFEADGVVEVLGVIRVDGDDPMFAAVDPTGEIAFLDGVANHMGFLKNGFGKVEGQVVLTKDGQHVDPFGIGRSQNFDDFALGAHLPGLPFPEFHDDFVADIGPTTDVAGFRNINVVGNPRIVGNDVTEAGTALECADDLHPATFQNADDRSGGGIGGAGAQAFGPDIPADQDAVLVQGGSRGIFRNDNLLQARFIRLEESFARAVHPDAPGNEVSFLRGDKAVVLDSGEASGALQGFEDGVQVATAGGREVKLSQQLGGGGRQIIFARQ